MRSCYPGDVNEAPTLPVFKGEVKEGRKRRFNGNYYRIRDVSVGVTAGGDNKSHTSYERDRDFN